MQIETLKLCHLINYVKRLSCFNRYKSNNYLSQSMTIMQQVLRTA